MPDQYTIVYFQQNAAWGAAEEYLALLISGLDKSRFRPILLCPNADQCRPLISACRAYADIKCYHDSGKSTLIKLYSYFRSIRADIIHFNDPALKGIVAARLAGCANLVMTFHTPALPWRYSWKGRLMRKLAFRGRIHVIALSPTNRQLLIDRHGFVADQITVIPCGLNPAKFRGPFEKAEIRYELGVPENKTLLVSVGRLVPQKAQHVLIEALSCLPADFLDKAFLSWGRGS